MALPDTLTVLLEVVGIGLAAWSLRRPVAVRPQRRVVIAGVATMWVLAVAGSAVGVTVLGQADGGGGHGHGAAVDGHDQAALAMDGHDDNSTESMPETGTAALHEHDGDTLHVHDARDPHVHGDSVVHLHDGDAPNRGADPEGGDEGHTHAPGEEH